MYTLAAYISSTLACQILPVAFRIYFCPNQLLNIATPTLTPDSPGTQHHPLLLCIVPEPVKND